MFFVGRPCRISLRKVVAVCLFVRHAVSGPCLLSFCQCPSSALADNGSRGRQVAESGRDASSPSYQAWSMCGQELSDARRRPCVGQAGGICSTDLPPRTLRWYSRAHLRACNLTPPCAIFVSFRGYFLNGCPIEGRRQATTDAKVAGKTALYWHPDPTSDGVGSLLDLPAPTPESVRKEFLHYYALLSGAFAQRRICHFLPSGVLATPPPPPLLTNPPRRQLAQPGARVNGLLRARRLGFQVAGLTPPSRDHKELFSKHQQCAPRSPRSVHPA